MEFVLFWLGFCVLVAVLAGARGRSAVGFFILSFLLSPLIGLIVLVLVRNLAAEERERRNRVQEQQRHVSTLGAVAHLSRVGVADEVKKLAELHASGALTEEEFSQQKARLLSATDELSLFSSITCARCGTSTLASATTCPGCGGKFVQSR